MITDFQKNAHAENMFQAYPNELVVALVMNCLAIQ